MWAGARELVDLDNDGFPDLFIATGSVYPEVERKLPAYLSTLPASCSATWGTGDSRNCSRKLEASFGSALQSRLCFWDFDNETATWTSW